MTCKDYNGYKVYPNGDIIGLSGRKMKGSVGKGGYIYYNIHGKKKLGHRIIAECFIPNPDNLPEVNHINGKSNNVENLEWCTKEYNLEHARRNDLHTKLKGEDIYCHKLTEDNVKFIKKNYIKGSKEYGMQHFADMFGVSKQAICRLLNNKSWRYI